MGSLLCPQLSLCSRVVSDSPELVPPSLPFRLGRPSVVSPLHPSVIVPSLPLPSLSFSLSFPRPSLSLPRLPLPLFVIPVSVSLPLPFFVVGWFSPTPWNTGQGGNSVLTVLGDQFFGLRRGLTSVPVSGCVFSPTSSYFMCPVYYYNSWTHFPLSRSERSPRHFFTVRSNDSRMIHRFGGFPLKGFGVVSLTSNGG